MFEATAVSQILAMLKERQLIREYSYFKFRNEYYGSEIDLCIVNNSKSILNLIEFKLSGNKYGKWFNNPEVIAFSKQYKSVNKYLVYLYQDEKKTLKSLEFETVNNDVRRYNIEYFLNNLETLII